MTTGSDTPVVQGYDFKHPARVNRDQLRMLESLHENGARLLGVFARGFEQGAPGPYSVRPLHGQR